MVAGYIVRVCSVGAHSLHVGTSMDVELLLAAELLPQIITTALELEQVASPMPKRIPSRPVLIRSWLVRVVLPPAAAETMVETPRPSG